MVVLCGGDGMGWDKGGLEGLEGLEGVGVGVGFLVC